MSDASQIILCADDYAMTDGVSAGIEELAALRRLSATSALVTTPHWPTHAARLASLRDRLAIGLHVNLTLGQPLAPMPRLCPDGRFPALKTVLASALTGRLDRAEIAAEIGRQLDRFTQGTGYPPDFVDGHQHVHALRGVRHALLDALQQRYPAGARPLVRDPADRPAGILARGAAPAKAATLAALAAGFGNTVRRAGFPTNHGFAGVSAFPVGGDIAAEFERFFRAAGPRQLVMCHPGRVDAELRGLDPLVERREQELAALRTLPHLPERLWHVSRSATGGPVVWPSIGAGHG